MDSRHGSRPSASGSQTSTVRGNFQYQELTYPTSTIRLLMIEEGDFDEPIRCHFSVHSLPGVPFASQSRVPMPALAPPFKAVSYCWGDDTMEWPIVLDGRRMFVTKSLDFILRAIIRSKEHKPLWIDQLCINQKDSPEKEKQVLLMRHIYATAESVPIWTGEDDKGTAELAMSTIRKLAKDRPSADTLRKGFYAAEPEGRVRDMIKELVETWDDAKVLSHHIVESSSSWIIPNAGSPEQQALSDFYNRDWFFRCWTFQEVVLSRSAHILCGNHAISWDEAGYAAVVLEHAPNKFDDLGVHAAKNTWFYQAGYNSAKTIPPLIELLATASGHNQASDPADRIFAFLGLARETAGKDVAQIDMALRPRYLSFPENTSKDVKHEKREAEAVSIYRDLAEYYIRKNGNLSILSYVYHTPSSEEPPSCPSWVPRWNRERPQYQIWQYQDTYESGFRSSLVRKTQIAHTSAANQDVLTVRGRPWRRVGVVSDVLKEENMKTISEDGHVTWDYGWMSKLNHLTEGDYSDETNLRKESLILTAGRRAFGQNPMNNELGDGGSEEGHKREFAACVAIRLQQELADAKQSFHSKTHLKEKIAFLQDFEVHADGNRPNAVVFGEQASLACVGRRFFRADNYVEGDYHDVGLVPGMTQPNDLICVLEGGSVPFVLRPPKSKDGYFSLAGECYVPDIMFGDDELNVIFDPSTPEFYTFHIK